MLGLIATGDQTILQALTKHAVLAADLGSRLEAASDLLYRETAHRFDTEGDGEWPPLAESTVAKKTSQGYGEPARALYAEGDLYESATSPYGPFSHRYFTRNAASASVVMLVDWDQNGWQVPVVLSEGTDNAGVSHTTSIPARPIWPPAEAMREPVRKIIEGP